MFLKEKVLKIQFKPPFSCVFSTFKTTLLSNHDNYCYNFMPFGLKNTSSTYQRLKDVVFAHQIGRNLEVYVDGMITGRSRAKDLSPGLISFSSSPQTKKLSF